MKKILVVSPVNDGEAVAIVELCKREGVSVLTTSQTWGASWSNLEDDIKTAVEQAVRDGVKVYGVELQGAAPTGCHNVDHHIYDGDDRSNPLSSIEQISSIIGVELNAFEQAVALNDRGYIPAMREAGISEDTIAEVRLLDRGAQGITSTHEEQAEEALANRETIGSLTLVRLPHSKCATITDRMFGCYENLLVICSDGECDFYGSGSIISELSNKFGGWAGGDLPKSGFWGACGADQSDVESFVKSLL